VATHQKGALARRSTIVFADESGFGLTPHVAHTWAPRGLTPILRHSYRDRSMVSAISAVTWRPCVRRARLRAHGLYFQLHRHGIRSRDAIGFLSHLLRHIRGPIDLVWDRLGAHTSGATWTFLLAHPRITVHHLPPYCPELNPDEYVWGHIKRHQLANSCPENHWSLRKNLHRAVRRIRSRPQLLASFIHAAALG
jgi:transposase